MGMGTGMAVEVHRSWRMDGKEISGEYGVHGMGIPELAFAADMI